MTPEQRIARTKRLVSAARALISLQVGLYVGAKRIENVLTSLGVEYQLKYRIFAEFTRLMPLDIPLGTARLFCEPIHVLKTDLRLAAVEARFREKLLEAVLEIIKSATDSEYTFTID